MPKTYLQNILRTSESPTVKDLFATLNKSGAASLKIITRDKADAPLAACICVTGKEETAEILAAVEAIEAKWHEET